MPRRTAPPGRETRPALPGRGAALLAAAIPLLGLAVAIAHSIADAPENRARLRERAEGALRERLGEATVSSARVDWLFRAEFGPVEIASSHGTDPPLLSAERVVVAPRLAALLSGRIEPGSVTLHGARFWPGPGGAELRRALERARRARKGGGAGRAGGPLPSMHARGLTVLVARGSGPPVEVGPLDVDVLVRSGEWGSDLSATARLPAGGRLALSVARERDRQDARAEADLALPGDLPQALAERVPLAFRAGRIRLRARARAGDDFRLATGRFLLQVNGLELAAARLGPRPWGPFFAHAEGDLRYDATAREAALSEVRATLGKRARAGLSADLALSWSGEPRVSVRARCEGLAFDELVAALPEDLQPPDAVPRPAGVLAARLDLSVPLPRPSDAAVAVELDLDDLRRATRASAPSWLAAPFTWRPPDPAPGEPPREIVVGPANPGFVPLAELPPALVRAVTASEDAGFFTHRGFDFQEIARALLEAQGGRLRGASTITQQLAKNLFLSSDRTLSRKVREALATVALEASVPKARLLEIYLNIAEWGPGVYGAGEAARFWFDKDARALSPKESAFLASVIPSPRRFAARLRRGGVSPWWQDRISDVLGKMWIQGQLTDEQLARALDEPLRTRPGLWPAGMPDEGEPSDADGETPEPAGPAAAPVP
ncbi:MAG TPA: biosynthetic peptidoglycan transglycosylase [Anaeromyxobacteraceae bacterium]|nr:biosynthetic peptidoglycan transglycosylase [Anaeromyxobacteraceae bacterium]